MSAQTTSPIDAVRSDIPPKPVTPAEAIPEAPAAALDPLTKPEGGFLEKAKEALLPIVEKAQVTLDQYAEAAEKKVQQLADRLDGTAAPGTAQSRDLTGNAQPASITTTTSDPLEKAKGVFGQVSSAVTSTFTQLTNTIETKTTTESHPGLITQVQNAVAKGQEKLDHLLDGQSTTAASHPVQTTTNTVPHAPIGSDPLAPGAPGTTGALPNPSGAPVPVPGSTLTTTPALPP